MCRSDEDPWHWHLTYRKDHAVEIDPASAQLLANFNKLDAATKISVLVQVDALAHRDSQS